MADDPGGRQPEGGVVVTVFRSRLRSDAQPSYGAVADEMESAARAMPGFIDFTRSTTDDGERVSIVTFDSWASHRAWRDDPRHRVAQQRGRDEFYTEYSIQVGEVSHRRRWAAS